MSKKATRRALLSSALSLLLCASMLVGTTFAWFTDSVTSTGNIIKSGTLEVEMYWADGKNDPAADTTTWTDAASGAIFDYDLWEPGYAEVYHVKIKNVGSLAMKYQLNIVPTGEVSELADVLDVYFLDPAEQVADRAALAGKTPVGTLSNVLAAMPTNTSGKLDANTEVTVTMGLKMQESAGNEYQDLSIGSDFAVVLSATQLTAERDSFGPDYDEFADYDGEISSAQALAAAIAEGGTFKLVQDIALDEAVVMTIEAGTSVALDLNGKTITGGMQAGSTEKHVYPIVNKGTLVLANGTVEGRGVGNYGDLTILDGTYVAQDTNGGGSIWAYSGSTTTVEGGTFIAADDTTSPGATCINVATGASMTVNGGTFTGDANQTYAIINGGTLTINDAKVSADHGVISNTGTLVINGGTFTQNGNLVQTSSLLYNTSGTATINGGTFLFNKDGKLDSGLMLYVSGGKLVVNGGTFNGNIITDMISSWGGTGSAQIKGGTFCEKPEFVADGYEATQNADGTWTVAPYQVSTGVEFVDAIANGKAVELTADIDLGKIDLTDAITNDVVINANGHKITTTEAYGVEVTAGKNITISNADVEMTKEGDYITYAAGFKVANGDYAGATITLENCTITMANTDWAYAVNMPASVKNLNLVIDNCTLEGAVAVQCWGDNNTITITNSELICNYTTSAMYTSFCAVLQSDGSNISENNTLVIDNCEFKYSGIDNFNSSIYSVKDRGNGNTVTVTNCVYGEKVVAG